MVTRGRLVLACALLSGLLLATAGPARAEVDGVCSATLNGIAIDRIDSLSSPLELDTTDTLQFEGVSEQGTLSARAALVIGPVTIDSKTTTYAFPQNEFSAAIPLDDASLYGVGLFRLVGTIDGCTAQAWVRVSGRFPLTTLTGLVGAGLTLGGLSGQLGAVVLRRRWSRLAATLGGLPTGIGIALLGQQAGRLQVSYPSLTLVGMLAAGIGFALADALNPARREDRRSRALATAPQSMSGRDRYAAPVPPRPDAASGHGVEDLGAGEWPAWCHVLAPVRVFDLADHTRVITHLEPGISYLGRRDVGGWVEIVTDEGAVGWVARGAIRLEGGHESIPADDLGAPE